MLPAHFSPCLLANHPLIEYTLARSRCRSSNDELRRLARGRLNELSTRPWRASRTGGTNSSTRPARATRRSATRCGRCCSVRPDAVPAVAGARVDTGRLGAGDVRHRGRHRGRCRQPAVAPVVHVARVAGRSRRAAPPVVRVEASGGRGLRRPVTRRRGGARTRSRVVGGVLHHDGDLERRDRARDGTGHDACRLSPRLTAGPARIFTHSRSAGRPGSSFVRIDSSMSTSAARASRATMGATIQRISSGMDRLSVTTSHSISTPPATSS